MTDLFLHGRKLNTVFDLLGSKENDITYSVGWALAQSPEFCSRFMMTIYQKQNIGETTAIHLQEHTGDEGYTDIEIVAEHARVIVEAKRGWSLPLESQLAKYARRLRNEAKRSVMVVITECSPEYVQGKLPKTVKTIPLRYLSWKQIAEIAERSSRARTHAEKRLLQQLSGYLRGVMSMQDQESNLVYVVALSSGRAHWSKLTWIEFVTKKKQYFHPFGGSGWPTVPPNYLGFRYNGKLQSVHHVDGYKVVTDLSAYFPEIDSKKWNASRGSDSYLLYQLGPAIRPAHEVRTGNIYPSGRVWAALDLLLTCKTISQARDLTKERRNTKR